MSTAALPRHRHRESARSVVQRLQAVPVQLFPPHVFTLQGVSSRRDGGIDTAPPPVSRTTTFDAPVAAGDGVTGDTCTELGMNSLCLVTTAALSPTRASTTGEGALISSLASPAAEQRLTYEVAAAHALRGGRVLFLSAPTSQAFSLTRFVVTVERQWMALQQQWQEALRAPPPETATLHYAENIRHVDGAGQTTSSCASACVALSETGLQSLSSDVQLRARRRAVLDAVGRVEVLPCTSMEDFYAVCQTYTFPTANLGEGATVASTPGDTPNLPSSNACDASDSRGGQRPSRSREPKMRDELVLPSTLPLADAGAVTATAAAAPPDSLLSAFFAATSPSASVRSSRRYGMDVVPLCIVDGFLGPMSTSALLERVSGQTIPLLHYVLCFLQRRLRCAVMVVEAGGSVATGNGASGGACGPPSSSLPGSLASVSSLSGGAPRSRSDGCGALPSPAMVLAASDLVQRLRVAHMHPAPFVPLSHAARSLAPSSVEHFSEIEHPPKKKAARAGTAVEHTSRTWCVPAPSVSLHDVQLSVAYVEWDAVRLPLPHNSGPMAAFDARSSATSCSDELLLPWSLAWRYRVHFMKTIVGEDVGTRVGGTDNFSQNCQGSPSGPVWSPSHRPRRSSRVLTYSSSTPSSMQYTGSWIRSSQWRYL